MLTKFNPPLDKKWGVKETFIFSIKYGLITLLGFLLISAISLNLFRPYYRTLITIDWLLLYAVWSFFLYNLLTARGATLLERILYPCLFLLFKIFISGIFSPILFWMIGIFYKPKKVKAT